jgi:hypothetical protein
MYLPTASIVLMLQMLGGAHGVLMPLSAKHETVD